MGSPNLLHQRNNCIYLLPPPQAPGSWLHSPFTLKFQHESISKTMYKQGANKEPGFFKYILPLALTHRLRLPPAHYWNKDREFPDEVNLRDKWGNTWPVKLEKVDNQVCFVDGWLDFVKDNHVEADNFIVFENSGPNNVLSFKLLDPITKCGTGGFNGLKSVREDQEEDSESEDQTTVGAFGERAEEEEEEDDDDAEEEEEDDDYDLEEESIHWRSGNNSSRNGAEDHMPQKRRTKAATSINRTKDIYATEIFESGVIPRPKNPYFVTRRRASRNDELYLPKNVVKDYNLHLPMKAIIRDSGGTEWATQLNEWGDGRRWYYGGWSNFCRKNHVQQGDDCVCEFLEEAGKGIILFVYKLNK